MIYKSIDKFLHIDKPDTRILNVLASGMKPFSFVNIENNIFSGNQNVTSFISAIFHFSMGNEMMQIGLQDNKLQYDITRVSTHPGLLKTDLHRGRGVVFDVIEDVRYYC